MENENGKHVLKFDQQMTECMMSQVRSLQLYKFISRVPVIHPNVPSIPLCLTNNSFLLVATISTSLIFARNGAEAKATGGSNVVCGGANRANH